MTNQRFESSPKFIVGDDPVLIFKTQGSVSDFLQLKSSSGETVLSIGTSGAIGSSTSAEFSSLTVSASVQLPFGTSLDSVVLTGIPIAPTASAATNSNQIATTSFVKTAINNLISSAPATLDTLDELAAALGDDANFASTVTNSLALKAPLESPALTGTPTAPLASGGTNSTVIATTSFVQQELSTFLPPGMMAPYAGSTAPSGWLLCGGQAVSRTTYAALFAAIGTTYGAGDGSTTFTLPDLRGRVPAGRDDMGPLGDSGRLSVSNSLGTATGGQTVSISTDNLPPHQHSIEHDHGSFSATSNTTPTNHTHDYTDRYTYLYTGNVDYGNYYNGYYPTSGTFTTGINSTSHAHSISIDVPNLTGSSGNGGFSNTALNIMQPTIILNYIIKA